MIGKCAICGQNGKLSFEHVPPRSAFNDKQIFIQGFDHLFDESSPVFQKKMKSNRGFGSYTLCESCNMKTGSWYGKDFVEFTRQGLAHLNEQEFKSYAIEGKYIIKPLNVLKQIFSMFLSVDKVGHFRDETSIPEFVLDKHSKALPTNIRLFLYSNMSSYKRQFGYCVVHDEVLGLQKWAEINFKPFGYFLTEDSLPAHKHMVEITAFKELNYDDKYQLTIRTPNLPVSSPMIGCYS